MTVDWKTTTAALALIVGMAAFPLTASAGSDSSAEETSASETAEASGEEMAGDEAEASGEEMAGDEAEGETEQATQDAEELPGEDPGSNPEIENTADDQAEEAN